MKKKLLISILITLYLVSPMIFAQEDNSINNDEPIIFNQNYAPVPYTPQVVFDSGPRPVTYGRMHIFSHNLGSLPASMDILFIDANNRVTGTNFSQWSWRDKRWLGIQWDRSFCDTEACHLFIGGNLGGGGVGNFNRIRVLMYQ